MENLSKKITMDVVVGVREAMFSSYAQEQATRLRIKMDMTPIRIVMAAILCKISRDTTPKWLKGAQGAK